MCGFQIQYSLIYHIKVSPFVRVPWDRLPKRVLGRIKSICSYIDVIWCMTSHSLVFQCREMGQSLLQPVDMGILSFQICSCVGESLISTPIFKSSTAGDTSIQTTLPYSMTVLAGIKGGAAAIIVHASPVIHLSELTSLDRKLAFIIPSFTSLELSVPRLNHNEVSAPLGAYPICLPFTCSLFDLR